jgi:hypothetical protein
LAAGLIVPSAGTIIFNVLGDLVKNGAKAEIPLASYDFSLGCALAIVGVAVAQKDMERARSLFVLFSLLVLILIGLDVILRYRWSEFEPAIVALSDFIAFAATFWAMWD